jgi:S1-C subfamily serine protease
VYADTRDWLPAHIERVADDGDIAVLRLDRPGAYPFVDRIADHAPQVGAPVAIIGYPLGAATPMDGNADGIIARSTLGVGTVSKSIPGVLQIDAFAMDGSSGSPVFAEDGSIAGVVYGGAREAAGRIVYAVPSSAIRAILH